MILLNVQCVYLSLESSYRCSYVSIQVEGNSFQCGDAVRVSDDMTLVHQLQDGHGEWADDIALVYIYLLMYVQTKAL